MRRTKILGIVLTLSLVLVSFMALANPEGAVHVGSMGETTWFSLPEHPEMMIFVMEVWRSPFGPYDFMEIYIFPDVMVAITDNEDVADWLDTLLGFPGFTIVVEDHELEVWRNGYKVWGELTVIAESTLFPGLMVEPLSILFEGEWGEGSRGGLMGKSGTEIEEIPGTGYAMTASWKRGRNAFVTVVFYAGTDLELTQMTLGFMARRMKFSIAPTP